ncbi:recombinase family protein [Romboutsia ilealis]|uniref:recombinase family protein n=1 Tax=Romboutsia ilealis TaxID=1115758 RepID=UPI0026F3C7E9|nr:recombinase family protein [Romboutsia ilealis]
MENIQGRKYGYIRVSSKDQCADKQIQALKEYGIDERDMFIDKISGKSFDRPEYLLLKNRILRNGDVLVIKELDRLGRDMDAIKDEWKQLEDMGVDIEVIDMPMINTTGKDTLEKKLISEIVFNLLCYMAQKEREKIKQRQAEGIQAMKDRNGGKGIGRPTVPVPDGFEDIYDKVFITKEITALKGMELLGLKKSTFYKFKKMIDEKRAEK